MRNDHLTRPRTPKYEALASVLTLVVNAADLPPVVRRLLGTTELIALSKANIRGCSRDIQPIGVPGQLQEVAGKLILCPLKYRMRDFVALLLVGIAMARECKLGILPTRHHLNSKVCIDSKIKCELRDREWRVNN